MKKIFLLIAILFPLIGFSQQQVINIGTSANDHTGDPLRTAFQKTNANFTEVYGQIVASATAGGTNAYTATPDPAITLVHGAKAIITFTNGNSTSVSLNLNATGVVPVKKFSSGSLVNLSSGDIPPGSQWLIIYDGTNAVYQISIPGAGGGGSGLSIGTTTISSGTDKRILYDNAGSLGEYLISGSGGTIPTTVSPVFTTPDIGNATGNISGNSATVTTIPTLSGDILNTGNATTYNGIVPLTKGGSGQSTANASLNAFLPSQTSNSGKFLSTDGSNTSWATPAGSGTVNAGTANQLTYYATSTNAVSGLTAITANRVLISNGSGLPIAATTTDAEINYVSGVTSAIQTQLGGKQSTITFGTGVQTALGVNIGSAGAPILFNGAGGTPSSIGLANGTGLPESGVTNLTADLALKALKYPITNTVTSNYTAALTDAGNAIEYNSASDGTITISPQSSIAWIADTYITLLQKSTGKFTIVMTGLTPINPSGSLTSTTAGSVITIKNVGGTDVWYVFNGIPNVSSVSGTTNRITSTGGITPVIDISSSYVGQSSITTTGTLTTGSTGSGFTIGSGTAGAWLTTIPNRTTLTASTEFPFNQTGTTNYQWNTGTLALQRFHTIGAPTISFVGLSSTTISETVDISQPLAGTNATVTTPSSQVGNFALGLNGGLRVYNTSFTNHGFFYQQANNVTRIGGGSNSNEYIEFSGGAVTTSVGVNIGTSGNGSIFAGTYNGISVAATTAKSVILKVGATTMSTSTGNTASAVSIQGTHGNQGTGENKALSIDTDINMNGSATAATVRLFDINPTRTNSTGLANLYGVTSRPTDGLNGFGTGTPTATLHVVGTTKLDGSVTLPTVGNKILIKEGSGGFMGQTTLVSGTKAVTVSGVTTSTRCFLTRVTPSGTTLTINYDCACTTNTVTIQADVAAGTINSADGSTLNYMLFEPAP